MIYRNPRSIIGWLAVAGAAFGGAGIGQAQVSVDGASLIDLGSPSVGGGSKLIDFGAPRGSLGVIDFDNDGFYDVFFNNNAGVSKRLFRNVPSPDVPGGRGFVDVSASSGISTDADSTARSAGAVVVFDYNNDGWSDIYTGGYVGTQAGLLFRNNGDATFTNVSAAAGVRTAAGIFIECASALDFNLDGYLDLFISHDRPVTRAFTLLVNNGDGTFTDRSDLVPQPAHFGRIYAGGATDLDQDGWPDYVSVLSNGVGLVLKNDANPAGGRRFRALAAGESGMSFLGPAPMGIAFGDYDGDGWQDLAITDASTGTYYRNVGGVLTRITPFATFFGWGTTWIDTTNKGRLDNYQAGSYSAANIDRLFLNNSDGTWTDARSALNTPALASQHCSKVDFDNDGLEDIFTINPLHSVSVYHNSSGGANHWLKIRLTGAAGTAGSPNLVNRDAVGTIVRVHAGGNVQVREILAGTSYGSGEDPRAHFGLGRSVSADKIEIVWPRAGSIASRTRTILGPIAANRIVSIDSRLCASDHDGSGAVEVGDIFAYLSAWFAQFGSCGVSSPCSGDFNLNGSVEVADIFAFLSAWFVEFGGGCGS